jgi:bifunctional non-homologous end joining protein LigD
MARAPAPRDTSIATYRARRDFSVTAEPAPATTEAKAAGAPIFVVQKHAASRLHWDFRLEHGGVLWSWAVPKGPSLDPRDKRLAMRTEDHPLDYANFRGVIPEGQYGAGTVETWDRGGWAPVGDAQAGLDKGELKFTLDGTRLRGRFVLIRLKPRPKERGESWLLIKEHDEHERSGADAAAMEAAKLPAKPAKPARRAKPAAIPGAKPGELPETLQPELASVAEKPPEGDGWLSEVKFDGYRLLAFKDGESVRLLTRNGHDWTARLPSVARAVGKIAPNDALLDGELVALREDGVSSFALLQQALSEGADNRLHLYLFDLLHLDGMDLRGCRLADRKQALAGLGPWSGALRYSDHMLGRAAEMRLQACGMGLEGVVCKRVDAPYRAGRSRDWLKLKCSGREEFAVLGWTPPAGARTGFGALQLGYRNRDGAWEYAGGVGAGFTEKELSALRARLDPLAAEPPAGMVYADERPDPAIRWVKPTLVAEIQFAGWSGGGRIRQGVYLGLREDKTVDEVVRDAADAEANRVPFAGRARAIVRASRPAKAASTRITKAAAPLKAEDAAVGGVHITHADRELWPGVTKRDLAEYWLAVADRALPEIAGRPLALVRCPEGIDGERFFQKHAKPGFPASIRAGEADGAPYLLIDDAAGLLACAQVSAIELHAWGSRLPDATHPDRLVFDLDPGDDVSFATVVAAAKEVRERLLAEKLESFCRTTGGKGLHVVVPVSPRAGWDETRAWCRRFAETMSADSPDRYLAKLAKADRTGRILIDWLRNGLGSTAVASLSPRARPGATVATRLTWREVGEKLDPAAFTIATVPQRLARRKADPWAGFDDVEQAVPASGKRSA